MKKAKVKPADAAPQKKRGRPPGSGKKPKAEAAAKPTKEQKATAKVEKQKAAATAAVGGAGHDPKLRALFLSYMQGENGCPSVPKLKKAVADANSKYRTALKKAKQDGFEQFMFDTAQLVSTAEGEEEFKSKIGRQLLAAQFMGSTIGSQLDLFNQPDRTPAVDRAFDEGQRASMENKAAVPPYDPSTPQYKSYMEGFHAHQKSLFDAGMKEKVEQTEKPGKANKAAAVSSGTVVPITRAQMLAQKGEFVGDADGDEAEDDGAEVYGDDENEDAGGFARRA